MARRPASRRPAGLLWQRAASFAARAHKHDHRADGITPYFAHCARVATTLSCLFGCADEVAIAAAFLHDVIEDTDVDYDQLREEFGPEVAACVAALTKNRALPEAAREREYDRGLATAGWRARLVKLADVYDNWMEARPAKRKRIMLERCRRAVKLASADAAARADTARAIRIVSVAAGL